MDAFGLCILLGFFGLIALFILWWRWKLSIARKASTWPTAEATIQSGNIEVVASSGYGDVKLPVFNFSYIVDSRYCYGRFSLQPYITDPRPGFIPRMIDRKLQVHYNPIKPEQWFIADNLIEGCRVGQEIGPHIVGYHPQ